MGKPTKHRCPVCDSMDISPCVFMPDVPVYCNVLLANRQDAITVSRGDIDFVFCEACGHYFNAVFDPNLIDYTEEYENSLHYSGRFQEYAQALANQLIEKYDLRDKTIIEIACGKGDFLKLMCDTGNNRGFGFDPSYCPERSDSSSPDDRITVVQDYYSDKYSNYTADLVCCRHALEHIQHPREFLEVVRRAIGKNNETVVFFEVPNVLFTLKDLGIWDIIYEHCGYFSENSLTQTFQRSGFRVCGTDSVFGNQFLYVEALPVDGSEQTIPNRLGNVGNLVDYAREFESKYKEKVDEWRAKLLEFKAGGLRVVAWGAGSKGVTFLNVLKNSDAVDYIVDLNPNKHGRFVPGTGHEVVSPEFLTSYKPNKVIVLNPIYADEIKKTLECLNVQAELVVDH